ncbi:MAG TPA: group III truncated hemoglobin [Chryseolinea sp.]|nr:group III truncated hemoglobin [Chryseolinea sp.]
MEPAKNDIRNVEDIKILVFTFYERVKKDDLLSTIINDQTIPNWSDHLNLMSEFWQTVLLNKEPYKGTPAKKHVDLPIGNQHFDRWITVFHQTLDDLFSGPVTEEAKFQAHKMAEIFRYKLELTRIS